MRVQRLSQLIPQAANITADNCDGSPAWGGLAPALLPGMCEPQSGPLASVLISKTGSLRCYAQAAGKSRPARPFSRNGAARLPVNGMKLPHRIKRPCGHVPPREERVLPRPLSLT